MKIEKISENQIKFLLTNEDLKEREIKLSELAQGSEKAQAFFRDIMTEAMLDCGFDAGNTPLMIEARPVSMDSVIIIVSKVLQDDALDNKSYLMPKSLKERKFKQEDIKENIHIEQNLNDNQNDLDEANAYIYSFKNFDDIINLSKRIINIYNSPNCLYKFNDKYFLVLQKNISFVDEIDYIILEYGEKLKSNTISKYYLEEYGEVIIKDNALEKLYNLA